MPLYDYKCPSCEKIFPTFRKIEERDNFTECPTCAVSMFRRISAPRVIPDYPGYECPVTGKWIEGRIAHQENLRRTGCRIYEPGETQQYEAQRRADDIALENAVAETAGQLVEALPPAKLERLCSEIDNGLDIAVVRQ